jgi:hypothetical protein
VVALDGLLIRYLSRGSHVIKPICFPSLNSLKKDASRRANVSGLNSIRSQVSCCLFSPVRFQVDAQIMSDPIPPDTHCRLEYKSDLYSFLAGDKYLSCLMAKLLRNLPVCRRRRAKALLTLLSRLLAWWRGSGTQAPLTLHHGCSSIYRPFLKLVQHLLSG